MKIRLVTAKLFHAGGLTDRRDEGDSSFPHFCQSAQKLDFLFSVL